MAITAKQAWDVFGRSDCLYRRDAVESALTAMATRISAQLKDLNPLMVCVMNGGLVPFGCLLPQFEFPLQTDYIHVSRYGDSQQGGRLEWRSGPMSSVRDRVVLLVDDILDEGITLAAVEERLIEDGAASVYKAVLVTKNKGQPPATQAHFSALDVPDRYVFGYGMDYEGYLRNLPGIYAVREDGA